MTAAAAPRVIGTKLVLTCGPAILVLRRDDIPTIPWPGFWDLPGGGLDPGETPVDCGLRELREETGLILTPGRLTDGHARPAFSAPGAVAWYFRATLTPAEAASARLGDEGSELRLMPLSQFLTDPQVVPHFRRIVTEVLG